MVAAAACSGGDAGLGEPCDSNSDCQSQFQCLNDVCVKDCERSPECGDGYECTSDGDCKLATGKVGDSCDSEIDCGPGLSCVIDPIGTTDKELHASCAASTAKRPAGSECFTDDECTNGTCAMGHCTDLCSSSRDCANGNSCVTVPRVEAVTSSLGQAAVFGGCLPTTGNVVWSIPVISPTAAILLPVPSSATYASLVFQVDDPVQKVGARSVMAPSGEFLYKECTAIAGPCTVFEEESQYYANAVRHQPESGESVLAMPTNPIVQLETGVYLVNASSFRPNGTPGSAIPKVTAVVKTGLTGALLDLHFYFLDLDQHPCREAFNGNTLQASTAAAQSSIFQNDFIGGINGLSNILSRGGIVLGSITYKDLDEAPDLDGLDIRNAGTLLAHGTDEKGINIFFVRTLSPVGLQAFGPGPGPAGLGGTRKSGIVIGVDTLCYRSWQQLARLTAHEVARYMGLYHNVEVDTQWKDQLFDTDDSPNNLMFYSELGGTELSINQRDILTRSPVLR